MGASVSIVSAVPAGDVIARETVAVESVDTGGSLYRKLEQASFELFAKERIPVLAGVKAALNDWVKKNPGYRVLDGRFMVIEQAMAIPKDRERAAEYLRSFVEDVKSNGLVASSLARSGQKDAIVAPPVK